MCRSSAARCRHKEGAELIGAATRRWREARDVSPPSRELSEPWRFCVLFAVAQRATFSVLRSSVSKDERDAGSADAHRKRADPVFPSATSPRSRPGKAMFRSCCCCGSPERSGRISSSVGCFHRSTAPHRHGAIECSLGISSERADYLGDLGSDRTFGTRCEAMNELRKPYREEAQSPWPGFGEKC